MLSACWFKCDDGKHGFCRISVQCPCCPQSEFAEFLNCRNLRVVLVCFVCGKVECVLLYIFVFENKTTRKFSHSTLP